VAILISEIFCLVVRKSFAIVFSESFEFLRRRMISRFLSMRARFFSARAAIAKAIFRSLGDSSSRRAPRLREIPVIDVQPDDSRIRWTGEATRTPVEPQFGKNLLRFLSWASGGGCTLRMIIVSLRSSVFGGLFFVLC
jgi:hypothetical protein